MSKTKNNSESKQLQKELKALEKHRKALEDKHKLMKEIEKEKKALKREQHWKRRERIQNLEDKLRKAFLITEKSGKKISSIIGKEAPKVKKFMKEEHI